MSRYSLVTSASDDIVSRAGQDTMFAVLRSKDREQLAREVYDLPLRTETGGNTDGETAVGAVSEPIGVIPLPGNKPGAGVLPRKTVKANQDVYFDLLVRLRQQQASPGREFYPGAYCSSMRDR